MSGTPSRAEGDGDPVADGIIGLLERPGEVAAAPMAVRDIAGSLHLPQRQVQHTIDSSQLMRVQWAKVRAQENANSVRVFYCDLSVKHTETRQPSQEDERLIAESEAKDLQKRLLLLQKQNRPSADRIEALHRYNEIRDMTTMLIGRLAEMEGLSSASIFERYDLGRDD